jgi:molecular chaperone DnaK
MPTVSSAWPRPTRRTGKSQNIEIKGASGLSDDEIEQMKKDAEAHAEEDKKRKEYVEARNKADTMVHQTKTALEEHGDKVSQEVRGNIETAVNAVEAAMKSETEDAAVLNSAVEELEKASMELGKAIYEEEAKKAQAAQQGGDAEAADESPKADDDVIDADYEVKDEK